MWLKCFIKCLAFFWVGDNLLYLKEWLKWKNISICFGMSCFFLPNTRFFWNFHNIYFHMDCTFYYEEKMKWRKRKEPKIKNCNFVKSLMICHHVDKGKLFLTALFYSNMDPFLNFPWASKKKLTDKSKGQVIKGVGMYYNWISLSINSDLTVS